MSTPSSSIAPSPPSTPKTPHHDPFSTPSSSRPSSIRPRTATSSLSVPGSPALRSILHLPSNSASSARLSAAASSYNVRPLSSAPLKKLPRMRSYMLPEGQSVPKPWTENPSFRHTIAYYITYLMIALAAAGGAVQTYLSYKNVELD
ncbi:hypothetical protein H0H93_006562, partial [Arthromyces matolae]